jgi:hypothetical protein
MSAAVAQVTRGHLTQARVVRSEWTKLWSLRSTRWTLLAAVVSMIAPGIIVAAFEMSRWATLPADERARFSAIDTGVGGYHLAQLAIGVLGVLVISGEYSTGMIRSSFMAVPRRLPVLFAKLGVYAAVTFVLMLVSTLVSYLVVQRIVRGSPSRCRARRSRRPSGDLRNRAVLDRPRRARGRPGGAGSQHRRRHRRAVRAPVRAPRRGRAAAACHRATRSARTCPSTLAARSRPTCSRARITWRRGPASRSSAATRLQ